jgi:hypothetical protein
MFYVRRAESAKHKNQLTTLHAVIASMKLIGGAATFARYFSPLAVAQGDDTMVSPK